MKSDSGFLVGGRLSLHHVSSVRFGYDRRQPRTGLAAETTGLCDLAIIGRIRAPGMRFFDDRERATAWLSGAVPGLPAMSAITTGMIGELPRGAVR